MEMENVKMSSRKRIALIQVLGAITYGEQKAYEGAKAREAETTDEAEARIWRKIAAEELRHRKGFTRRLQAYGADPERAMAPYRSSLEHYHGLPKGEELEGAVWSYLGEGIADDMLHWLVKVVDKETAAFIETVIEDEKGHEAHALANLKSLMAEVPDGRARAVKAARRMLLRMGESSEGNIAPFTAFLALGRPQELLYNLAAGYVRRVASLGGGPLGRAKEALDVIDSVARRVVSLAA